MIEGKFNEEDRDNFVKFLNFVHLKSEFKMSSKEALEYAKLLNKMQTSILPKIEKNIFEIVEVNDNDNEETKEE